MKELNDPFYKAIKLSLESLGYKKNEVKICLVLIHTKEGKISSIARLTDIPRQSTYSILKRLSEKGLIVATSKHGIRVFSCSYRYVIDFVKNEQKKVSRILRTLESQTSFSEVTSDTRGNLPHVVYYEGSLGLRHLFEGILKTFKKGKYKQFRGWGINFFAKTYGLEDYLRYFIKRRGELGIETRLFIAKGPDDFRIQNEKERFGRNIRHLNIDEQNAGIYLIGNRVYLFSYKENVGVMIENQEIMNFLINIFDDHWKKTGSE